uniref:Reverse transcriptase domain-containing protein n=1 Tax=Amphimedon queenslandica TaxID=400682 RepID=A0A1X7UBN0_AMPQE
MASKQESKSCSRCNRTGVCRGCACVKASRACTGCLPRRLGTCLNLQQPPPSVSAVAPVDSTFDSTCDSVCSNDLSSQVSSSLPVSPTSSPSLPIPDLPTFSPAVEPSFTWGSVDGVSCASAINDCYSVAVNWKPNLFRVPSGKVGDAFIQELSRLFRVYGSSTALESVTLKAAILLPMLLLQCPSQGAKHQELIEHLERRLILWKDGSFCELLHEGSSHQARLPKSKSTKHSTDSDIGRLFTNNMNNGNVKSALCFLSQKVKGNVLSLDQPSDPHCPSGPSKHDALIAKHPQPGPIHCHSILLQDTPSPNHNLHPVIFDSIDCDLIRCMSLCVHGAGGPSGVDALSSRRYCSSFMSSPDLCHSLAIVALCLSSTSVDPDSLSAFVACRLIALNKDPGVRPIGIGETCRRIISKAILSILGQDVIEAAGPIQLCTGLDGGCEAAVHSLCHLFADTNTEAVLLVDATNAFNSLNRAAALRNVLELCPSLGRVLVNTYRENVDLYIDGEIIVSQEGTTQGDPLAMAMYSLGVIPLIIRMSEIQSTRQGRPVLGSPLGTDDYISTWVQEKIKGFFDALCLRYGYLPSSLPTNCSCGIPLSIDHCLNCHLGGFTILRHNGVCDLTARLLNEVCHNVTIEPPLQSLFGETLQLKSAITTDNARLDIKADGFWDCCVYPSSGSIEYT